MVLNLQGKIAIVTGASRGLGKAIALRLAEEGVHIVVNFKGNADKAEETAESIRKQYPVKVIAIRADVANEADVARLFAETEEKLGPADILINNAGINPISMVYDMELGEWNDIINTNLTGTFLACREMVRHLMDTGRKGCIVNITSQAAFNGSKSGKSHYAASKGGVASFTISLAKEVAHLGIRVNAVSPGLMYTDMTQCILDTPEKIARYNNQIPAGRVADVDEVARIAVFLASDISSYMNGSIVDVSGGLGGR